MTTEQKEKLALVIKNNAKWPLIVENTVASNFRAGVVLPATILSSELGVKVNENGLEYPDWLQQIIDKSNNSKKVFLVISGLDKIDSEEQEKFYGLIKYNGVNGYKFAPSVQIIIPVTANGVEKISKKISSLCLVHKVD